MRHGELEEVTAQLQSWLRTAAVIGSLIATAATAWTRVESRLATAEAHMNDITDRLRRIERTLDTHARE